MDYEEIVIGTIINDQITKETTDDWMHPQLVRMQTSGELCFIFIYNGCRYSAISDRMYSDFNTEDRIILAATILKFIEDGRMKEYLKFVNL